MAEALAEWAASAHCVNYVVGCDGVVGSGTFLYRLISVFESGRVSVVGLADNPPPELTEVGHYNPGFS